MNIRILTFFLLVLPLFLGVPTTFAQSGGTIRGVVTLSGTTTPVKNASIVISELNRATTTDGNGNYEFTNVPSGKYVVVAHMDKFPDFTATVELSDSTEAKADFELALTTQDPITITVIGREQSAFDAFQSVTVLESVQLAEKSQASLGEVLEHQPGIAKRSFGPGSARPIIRGFDGDRVLVLQDGLRAGSLASQSGDHGETVDVNSLDKIEIVKGPATLLYGSNAIGGVVNAITGHHEVHDFNHTGLRGYFTGLGGSNNSQGGANGGLEYGYKRFSFFGNGGGQRTDDYETPLGVVRNSKTRISNGSGGFGYYGDKVYFSGSYGYSDGRYGIPFAAQFEGGGEEEESSLRRSIKRFNKGVNRQGVIRPFGEGGGEDLIDLAFRRHNARFDLGIRNIDSFITSARLNLNYSDYRHRELENGETATLFNNDEVSYRAVFEQRKVGRFSGSFGFSGFNRDYETIGAEALAPPVDQNNFAFFGLEQISFEKAQLQFGGRVETNRYNAEGLRDRTFTGFSGAAGIRVPVFEGAAFVANYTHSYRAPALEELYNNGPHIGTLTFEIGNVNLRRELTNGVDLSFRYAGKRFRSEVNFYYYDIDSFVFLAPTGDIEDGLPVANYAQADSRFVGTEVGMDYKITNFLFLNAGLDAVDAEIKNTDSPLPRIPPLRGRIGLEANYKGFSLRPEVLMARSQNQIFSAETRTPGYTVVNLRASYTLLQKHAAHVFSVNGFNLGDRLYFNHTSLIKDLAPEIGRGVRFTYTVRFF